MFCQSLEGLIMYSNLSVYFTHLAKNKLKSPSKSYIHAGYKLLLKVVVLAGASFILSTPFEGKRTPPISEGLNRLAKQQPGKLRGININCRWSNVWANTNYHGQI